MNPRICLVLLLAAFVAGCASSDVNPGRPRPHTGYVDFFVDPDESVCWQVLRMDDGKPVKLFEEYEPSDAQILRLAFAPGEYHLRVSVLNHIVAQPGAMDIDVKDGMITPVRVTLAEGGRVQFETREVRVGGTYYGRFGRGTKIRSREAGALRIDVAPQEPLAYQPKMKMPYAVPQTNSPAAPAGSAN